MGVKRKIALLNVTSRAIHEIDTEAIMDEVAIDDIYKCTVDEKHPSFIIIIITGGRR